MKSQLLSCIFIGLLAFGLFAATPSTTYACSCIAPGTPAEEFDQTDAIFAGQVTAVEMVSKTDFAPYEITLQVAESWKGVTEEEISVYTGLTGVSCAYGFVNGKRYLVYAYQDSKTDKLIASMCSPTKLVDDATEDLAYLRANHGSVNRDPDDDNVVAASQSSGSNEAAVTLGNGSKAQLRTLIERYFGRSFYGMPERSISIDFGKVPEDLPFDAEVLERFDVVGYIAEMGEHPHTQLYLTANADAQATQQKLEDGLEESGFIERSSASARRNTVFLGQEPIAKTFCNAESQTLLNYTIFTRSSGETELFIRIDEISPFNSQCTDRLNAPSPSAPQVVPDHTAVLPRLKVPPNTTIEPSGGGHGMREAFTEAKLTSSLTVSELMAFYQEQLLDLDWEQIETSQTNKLGWSGWRFADEQGRHWDATVYLVRKAGTDDQFVITMRANVAAKAQTVGTEDDSEQRESIQDE